MTVSFYDIRARRIAIGIVLGVLLSMAMGAPGSAAQKATLLLDWTPNTNHTGVYVALDKGWYEDVGLDLKVITPSGNSSVESIVAAGKVEFGISFQEWVTSARTEGLPIVSVAAVIQHNTSGFASVDRGIERPKDFEGKRYGGWGLPIEKAILKAVMKADGGDVDKVKFVNIGMGDLLVMLQRDVDVAWIYYGWQGVEAKLRGLDLDLVMMSDYFNAVPDYYTPVVITSESMIARDPGTVQAFVEATARGYEYAASHPEEAASILVRRVPELDSELVRHSQEWLSPRYADDAPQWGFQGQKVWQDFGDWMYANQLIEKRFDGAAAFTNRFLPGQ